jgi:hypothetical protein
MSGPEKRHADRPNGVARDDCYARVRKAFLDELNTYYKIHPEWLLDPRSRSKLELLSRIRHNVLVALNDFEIARKPPDSQSSEPGGIIPLDRP